MERRSAPPLLPILRSQQQGELLAYVLDDPSRESSLTDIHDRLDIPVSSVHREVERAERSGIVTTRKVGATRLVVANVESPYYEPLRRLLLIAFGPVERIRTALEQVEDIDAAYVFGSWAAAANGSSTGRPVADIDLLILGEPERSEVFRRLGGVEQAIGRPVQVTFRPAGWIEDGTGSFHDTVLSRPMVPIPMK